MTDTPSSRTERAKLRKVTAPSGFVSAYEVLVDDVVVGVVASVSRRPRGPRSRGPVDRPPAPVVRWQHAASLADLDEFAWSNRYRRTDAVTDLLQG